MEVVKNFIVQIFMSVGIVTVFAVAIYYLNILFIKILGYRGFKAHVITGAVGTPVHELGHAAMCVLFGHKITEIKLYTPKSDSGTLGYVSHSYKKNNFYHQLGNFFIGIGPIISGSVAMFVLMLITMPDTLGKITAIYSSYGQYSVTAYFNIFLALFDIKNFLIFSWWFFMLVSASIALHMRISPSDIKTSKIGFLYLSVLILIVDAILCLIDPKLLESVTKGYVSLGAIMVNFLLVALLLSLFTIAIAVIIKGIISTVKKLKK